MSDNLKKYSFNDLLKQGKIRIPKIQRDYAQGRQSRKVDEIRKVFVHTLLLVVKGKRPATELDFVYGSKNNNAFEPLDGQQRLTTLFLLHWMMGVSLYMLGDKKHSIFTYETRNTSNEFCDELIQHEAFNIVKETIKNIELNKSIKDDKEKKPELPSVIIKGRDWFKWEWKYDPTILSMLVMIDAIFTEMGTDWNMDLSICRNNLEHITFNLLNLGEFGLSNELFIKMNARGKQLSDFDKLKSTLEEELQIQQKEKDEQGNKLASEKDEEMWRSLMDGAWIDLFWHKYACKTIVETESVPDEGRKKDRLRVAKTSELQFKKLLLRLIAIQLFESKKMLENEKKVENIDSKENLRVVKYEKLCEATYNIDESKIDNLLFEYMDSLTDLRSDDKHLIVPSPFLVIDFNQLMNDVNLLIYKENNDNIYGEISNLLPKISHIENDDRTLFDSFLETKVPNDVELTFYAMLLFLRSFPEKKNKKSEDESIAWYFDKNTHGAWLKNFEDWVHSARNILLNDNNNQRIDKIQFSKEATQSLKQMTEDFVTFVLEQSLNIEDDKYVVRKFFASSDKTYQRLDNQSLAEERRKASLILDSTEWESCIDNAEQHPYLWGQIRCLLNWSEDNLDSFKEYSSRLLQLLDCIRDNGATFYSAMLVFSPNCWKESNRLYQYNKDRDNSFKRYMREHTKEGQAYGSNIKAMIDLWMKSYATKSAKDFLEALIADRQAQSPSWIQCVVKSPTILDEAWNKRIYSQKGHVIMAQRKTRDSHCFDPILVYFRNLCRKKGIDSSKYKLYDSKGEYEYAFKLELNTHKYFVNWSKIESYYTISEDSSEKECSPSEVVSFIENCFSEITN